MTNRSKMKAEALEMRLARTTELLDDLKAEEITAIDLRGMTDYTDAFVIATMRSSTHMQATAINLRDQLRDNGLRPLNPVEANEGTWALLDYGDIIVHLFERQSREYYDLEGLWADAERLDWQQLIAERASA